MSIYDDYQFEKGELRARGLDPYFDNQYAPVVNRPNRFEAMVLALADDVVLKLSPGDYRGLIDYMDDIGIDREDYRADGFEVWMA